MTYIKPKRAARRRTAVQLEPTGWVQLDAIVRARAAGRCECCGKPLVAVERHHRQRRRDGGDVPSNLVALLPDCHRRAHSHPEQARATGVIVSAYADPKSMPLWQYAERPVLLDDIGIAHPVTALTA